MTGRRVVATIIDGLVFGVAYWLLAAAFGDVRTEVEAATWVSNLPVWASVAYGLFVFAYFVLLEGYLGQTLGKLATGIKVVGEATGTTPGIAPAAVRTLVVRTKQRPDRFERSISRNLYQLDPNIAPLAVGDAMPFYPGAPMTVAEADPPHALVLWQVTSGGKAIDPAGPWGEDYVAWSWAFVLEPVEVATTRLLVRMRVSYQPAFRWGPAMWLLVEPAHFVMGRRQLLGIRQRAETARLPDDQERTAPPMTAGAEAVAEAVRAT